MTKTTSGEDENLHVITDNGEQCFVWRSNQLTYISQDRSELPAELAHKFGPLATKLDLSFNSLTSFNNINSFTNLSELILDNNCLSDDQIDFKQNLRLKTLSLNKNKLTDLNKLVNAIKVSFPNLEYLSLLGNPLCPGHAIDPPQQSTSTSSIRPKLELHSTSTIFISNTGRANQYDFDNHWDDEDLSDIEFGYQKYRLFIIYNMPNLRFLDWSPIKDQERDEALRKCYWMSKKLETSNSNKDLHRSHYPMNGAALNNIDRGSQLEDGTHKILRPEDIDPGSHLTNNSQVSDNFQLLAIVPDDELRAQSSECNQMLQLDQPRGAFSRLAYKYTGKDSEGNRFIRNKDL